MPGSPVAIGFDTASTITDAVLDRAVAKKVGAICVYSKYMTSALVQRISARGINIISVFESTATRALAGATAGAADGAQALGVVRSCGQPDGAAIYCTVDFDTVAAQDATIMAYLRAFGAAIAPMTAGIYGNGAVCQGALDAGLARYTWLAGGSGMRGTKTFDAADQATIEQDVDDKQGEALGISIDSDRILAADYGGWRVGTAAVVASAVPVRGGGAAIEQPAPQPATGSTGAAGAKLSIPGAIAALQSLLTTAGFSPGPADGLYGPRTAAALQAYTASL